MIKVYPAIFHEEGIGYWVEFPDLKGCLTEGDTLQNAIRMAEDALGGWLACQFEEHIELPRPSDISTVHTNDGFVNYVATDVSKFLSKKKAVKKTLTIPGWLNEEAEKVGVNFSAILQKALMKELQID